MVFHWSLNDSKSPQVSRTLLSILAVRNNVVVWMVPTRPPTSKSSRPFNNPLVTVPKAPITVGTYPIIYFLSVLSCGLPEQRCPQFCKFSFWVDYYKVVIIMIIIISFSIMFFIFLHFFSGLLLFWVTLLHSHSKFSPNELFSKE